MIKRAEDWTSMNQSRALASLAQFLLISKKKEMAEDRPWFLLPVWPVKTILYFSFLFLIFGGLGALSSGCNIKVRFCLNYNAVCCRFIDHRGAVQSGEPWLQEKLLVIFVRLSGRLVGDCCDPWTKRAPRALTIPDVCEYTVTAAHFCRRALGLGWRIVGRSFDFPSLNILANVFHWPEGWPYAKSANRERGPRYRTHHLHMECWQTPVTGDVNMTGVCGYS